MNNINKNNIPEKNYGEWYSWEHLRLYPHLKKLLIDRNDTRYYRYLMAIIEKIQHGTNYAHGIAAERYLADSFSITPKKANQILNFFCTLKIFVKKRQRLKNGSTDTRIAITYQIAPRSENYLRMIDERAAVILDKKLTLNSISWETVRSCFGEDEANAIYSLEEETRLYGSCQKRERGVIPQIYEQLFAEQLEVLTKEQPWTSKAELIQAVMRITDETERAVADRFAQFKPSLIDRGYTYKMTGKADAAAVLGLPVGRYLIFRRAATTYGGDGGAAPIPSE